MGPLSVFRQLGAWELMTSAPRGPVCREGGQVHARHFGRLVGPATTPGCSAPFLSAVPSQAVDDFPAAGAGSLFKSRPRRKDVVKSFTFAGGVGAVSTRWRRATASTCAPTRRPARCAATARASRASCRRAAAHGPGGAWRRAAGGGGARSSARHFAALAGTLGGVASARSLESLGVVLPGPRCPPARAGRSWCPSATSSGRRYPRSGARSTARRAFSFHFRPGHSRAAQLARILALLEVPESALEDVSERRTTLPAPALGHADVVAALDRQLAGSGLALTGNYFAGLAIEDCVERSRAEWSRLAALG